jgi:beta-galactosidase/beta-glucuronidase
MHTIRLRGPWQIEPLTGLGPTTPVETTVPGDWSAALSADFRGSARYSRRFGLPTNLSPAERVSLVVEQVHWQATITLNGQLLGTQTAADGVRKYDVTQLLQLRNGLQIVVEVPADQTGPGSLGEVRLEIESP